MSEFDITRTVEIHAPARRVWAALTDPAKIALWFGDTAEFDARPGGRAVFGWREHGGDFHARVERVDEPRTLVYRWARDFGVDPAPGNSTLVRFELEEIAGGTRLTVIETGFEDLDDPRGAHDGNAEGWRNELAELVAFCEAVVAS
ncbi:SRPBCC family protein [Mycolicibacterium palauense]|uniref:SRPBCC family protein n=1 Tax=Mycolicibacterium palauense TaxID=2034511 RepID=UPI000BFEBC61|nr:SRPBCC family protein [Mycolicibacterium palauense]